MDKNAFLDELANILDETNVTDATRLFGHQSWDSLAILSVVSLAISKFGFALNATDVKNMATVGDLWVWFEKNRTK